MNAIKRALADDQKLDSDFFEQLTEDMLSNNEVQSDNTKNFDNLKEKLEKACNDVKKYVTDLNLNKYLENAGKILKSKNQQVKAPGVKSENFDPNSNKLSGNESLQVFYGLIDKKYQGNSCRTPGGVYMNVKNSNICQNKVTDYVDTFGISGLKFLPLFDFVLQSKNKNEFLISNVKLSSINSAEEATSYFTDLITYCTGKKIKISEIQGLNETIKNNFKQTQLFKFNKLDGCITKFIAKYDKIIGIIEQNNGVVSTPEELKALKEGLMEAYNANKKVASIKADEYYEKQKNEYVLYPAKKSKIDKINNYVKMKLVYVNEIAKAKIENNANSLTTKLKETIKNHVAEYAPTNYVLMIPEYRNKANELNNTELDNYFHGIVALYNIYKQLENLTNENERKSLKESLYSATSLAQMYTSIDRYLSISRQDKEATVRNTIDIQNIAKIDDETLKTIIGKNNVKDICKHFAHMALTCEDNAAGRVGDGCIAKTEDKNKIIDEYISNNTDKVKDGFDLAIKIHNLKIHRDDKGKFSVLGDENKNLMNSMYNLLLNLLDQKDKEKINQLTNEQDEIIKAKKANDAETKEQIDSLGQLVDILEKTPEQDQDKDKKILDHNYMQAMVDKFDEEYNILTILEVDDLKAEILRIIKAKHLKPSKDYADLHQAVDSGVRGYIEVKLAE